MPSAETAMDHGLARGSKCSMPSRWLKMALQGFSMPSRWLKMLYALKMAQYGLKMLYALKMVQDGSTTMMLSMTVLRAGEATD